MQLSASRVAFVVLGLALCSAPAQAQSGGTPRPTARPGGSGGSSGGGSGHGNVARKVQRIFNQLDADNDGKISAAEAAAAPNGGQRVMAADKDGDGFVTRRELRNHLVKRAARHKAQQTFDRLDRNNDGFLGPRELRRASSKLKRKLRGADTDNDGKISQAEYMAALGHAAQQAHQNRQAIRQAMRAFKAADANNDRKLEASEWPSGASATFAAVDADGDGTVTGREVAAYMRANNASPF